MRIHYLILSLFSCWGTSCNLETSNSLTKDDTLRIQKLGLLDKNEKIIYFTSNYLKESAGSFYTDKRVARYWLEKNTVDYAYYKDIKNIDTTFNVNSLTQASYLDIKKTTGPI